MIRFQITLLILINYTVPVFAQASIDSFRYGSDIKITIDAPSRLNTKNSLWLIWYALPNGNTTAQTMGKKVMPGDDWHFDIQHIAAQTAFLRHTVKKTDIVVVYAENDLKSWPAWKNSHSDYAKITQRLMDTVSGMFSHRDKQVQLNGHSGGGRFIFSYIDCMNEIPSFIKRISFLDSNYGYDSTYLPKFSNWLKKNKDTHLSVFAYNDSVALYKGKTFVSATGGTWYRSRLMLREFSPLFTMKENISDSMLHYSTRDKRLQVYLKTNPGQEIYHTKQVELNGFIHSVLCGTRFDSRAYQYYGKRVYEKFIE